MLCDTFGSITGDKRLIFPARYLRNPPQATEKLQKHGIVNAAQVFVIIRSLPISVKAKIGQDGKNTELGTAFLVSR